MARSHDILLGPDSRAGTGLLRPRQSIVGPRRFGGHVTTMPLSSDLRDVLSFDRDALAPRVTVWLTLAVAVLSVVTGVANISAQSVVGPLAELIPAEVQRIAGFTGVLTGFLMLASALGLRRGLRVAWFSTVALLPMTALQGLLQSSPLSAPLVVFSIFALPNVLLTRKRFTRSLSLSTALLSALLAIVGVQVYGTVGTYALREEFGAVRTLVDASDVSNPLTPRRFTGE